MVTSIRTHGAKFSDPNAVVSLLKMNHGESFCSTFLNVQPKTKTKTVDVSGIITMAVTTTATQLDVATAFTTTTTLITPVNPTDFSTSTVTIYNFGVMNKRGRRAVDVELPDCISSIKLQG